MKQKRKTLKEWCEEDLEQRGYLLDEWAYEKNNDITPSELSYGSANKVWWRCDKMHEYIATPNHRTRGGSCTYCKGNKVLTGYNDLATLFPHIAKEWKYEKNTLLSPTMVAPGCNKKVWWKCCICGNEWEATINHRTSKIGSTGCPECAKKERARQHMLAQKGINDFATLNPQLVKEWDYEKNYPLRPDEIKASSNQKYYWICPKGHSYKSTAGHRTSDRGCPVCVGKMTIPGVNDLATTHPMLVEDWDYELNGTLTPMNISHGSDKKVHWKCQKCGNKWVAAISDRSSGRGCPKCSKEIQTSFPEQAIYYYVKKYFSDTVNSDTKAIGMELDIYIPSEKIAIEYDGVRWHTDVNRQKVEVQKNEACNNAGILLIRVREDGLEEYEDCAVCITRNNNHSAKELSEVIIQVLSHISNSIMPDVDVERDSGEIYSQYIIREKSLSLQALYPEIAAEWHPEKNGVLKPDKIRAMSNKKFWWKCKLGHEFFMSANDRTGAKHSGCPYCSGRKVLKGFNDLASVASDIAEEWNYNKNGSLTPDQITKGSNKIVWWKCSGCGREWRTSPSARRNTKCKKCNQEAAALIWAHANTGIDDLATLAPDIASEWDYEANGNLLPTDITLRSNRVIHWKCSKCGGKWEATANTRSSGCGCPYCAGKRVNPGVNDLATIAPDKIKLWDYEANDPLKPEDVIASSHKVVRWRCENGHTWKRPVRDEVKSQGCPICLGKPKIRKTSQGRIRINQDLGSHSLLSTHPELCKEWDCDKNGENTPNYYSAGSGYKAWWKCSKGHSWQAVISSRALSKRGCPYCSGNLILTGYNDLATKRPELLREWDYSKNTDVQPNEIGSGSNVKVWWKCSVCGNEYKSAVSGRSAGRGCYECGRRRMGKTKKIRCVETEAIYNSAADAGKALGVSGDAVSACARGESKTCCGYHWEYV